VSAANVQPLQNMLNAAARIIRRKRKFDEITTDVRDRLHRLPVQQRIKYKLSWCASVCIKQHQHISLNCAHRCLNQPIVFTCVPLHVVTLQCHAPEQRRFGVSGPTLLNSLPLSVRDPSMTPIQFCALLKTVLFCGAIPVTHRHDDIIHTNTAAAAVYCTGKLSTDSRQSRCHT